MNLPNLLTLSRIPVLFIILGLLYAPVPGARTAAFVFFIIGALTDWLDGYYARKMKLVSDFGKLMDALTDKVFMVGLFVTLLCAHSASERVDTILPAWSLPLLLLILSREFLITGLRLVAASTGTILAAEKGGKHKTVSQIVCVVLLLLHEALVADLPSLGNSFLGTLLYGSGVGFFCLATLLTVSSGTQYMVKYWKLFTGQHEGGESE